MPFRIQAAQPAISVMGFEANANTAREALAEAQAMSQYGLLQVLVMDHRHKLYSLEELERIAADDATSRERDH